MSFGAPGRDRTVDLSIKSRLLCRLSYRRMDKEEWLFARPRLFTQCPNLSNTLICLPYAPRQNHSDRGTWHLHPLVRPTASDALSTTDLSAQRIVYHSICPYVLVEIQVLSSRLPASTGAESGAFTKVAAHLLGSAHPSLFHAENSWQNLLSLFLWFASLHPLLIRSAFITNHPVSYSV